MNKSLAGTLGVLALVLIFGAYWAYGPRNNEGQQAETELSSVSVERPYIIARGNGLDRVELWAVPTGTGITESGHAKLGDMRQFAVGTSTELAWRIEIPAEPMTVTEIYAKGFDSKGTEYRKSLDISGATEIYNALWLTPASTTRALKQGEKMSMDDFSLTFDKIESDSRCPADVQCVQAGSLVAVVSVEDDDTSGGEAIKIDSASEGVPYNGYFVSIAGIEPEAPAVGNSDYSSYKVTFRIERDIKL